MPVADPIPVRAGVSAESRRIVESLWRLPPSAGLTLQQWRANAASGENEPWPDGMRAEPVEVGGFDAEWTWFDGVGRDGAVVVVIHGGGFVLCSIATHRILGARLARACGGRALMVGYRLAPEHPFPAALDDCVAAVRWLLWAEGVDPARTVLFGDSAGGNLCLATLGVLAAAGDPIPAGAILASPLTDLTGSGASLVANAGMDPFARLDDIARFADLYLDGGDPRHPAASPLFGDLGHLPPVLVQVGLHESLLDDSLRLHAAAVAAGAPVELDVIEGAFHTWLNYAGTLPEADEALARMGTWVRAVAG